MQVLEENDTNWLILTDEGSTETKTKASDLNKLLYGKDLWGLLDTGSEVWINSGAEGEPKVTLIPDDNAECYTIRLEKGDDLHLGAHHKTDLVDALAEMYEEHDGESVAPILDLYEEIREGMVRGEVLSAFLRGGIADRVEQREGGWFINGHLLLTWEGDFYHPNNVSRNRSGSVIGKGTSVEAYGVNIDPPTGDMAREVTVEGKTYRLTNAEVEFLARAMWGIENTLDKR